MLGTPGASTTLTSSDSARRRLWSSSDMRSGNRRWRERGRPRPDHSQRAKLHGRRHRRPRLRGLTSGTRSRHGAPFALRTSWQRGNRPLTIVARLRRGATRSEADAAAATTRARLPRRICNHRGRYRRQPSLAIILPPFAAAPTSADGGRHRRHPDGGCRARARWRANVAGLRLAHHRMRSRWRCLRSAPAARPCSPIARRKPVAGHAGGLSGLLLSAVDSDVLLSFFRRSRRDAGYVVDANRRSSVRWRWAPACSGSSRDPRVAVRFA